MSAIPADDVQTSPAWNCGCKGSELFCIEQEKLLWGSDFSSAERIESPNNIRENRHR